MSLPACKAARRSQYGVTLIEVLITMVVMSLGLLGFASLQAVSLKSGRIALQRSYATLYAYGIADCMRANRSAAEDGDYNLDFDDDATPGSVAGDEMVDWKTSLAGSLPEGEGSVNVDSGVVTIDVRWKESVTSDRTLTFQTQTSL